MHQRSTLIFVVTLLLAGSALCGEVVIIRSNAADEQFSKTAQASLYAAVLEKPFIMDGVSRRLKALEDEDGSFPANVVAVVRLDTTRTETGRIVALTCRPVPDGSHDESEDNPLIALAIVRYHDGVLVAGPRRTFDFGVSGAIHLRHLDLAVVTLAQGAFVLLRVGTYGGTSGAKVGSTFAWLGRLQLRDELSTSWEGLLDMEATTRDWQSMGAPVMTRTLRFDDVDRDGADDVVLITRNTLFGKPIPVEGAKNPEGRSFALWNGVRFGEPDDGPHEALGIRLDARIVE